MGGATPPLSPRPPRPGAPRSGPPGVEDLALPRAGGLRVQPPVLLGDVVGVEGGARCHRAGHRDRRDVDAGRLVGACEQLGERADAGLAQRQARHLGDRLRHPAGDEDRARAGLRPWPGPRWATAVIAPDDVDRPRVELLARRELAEHVRLDQRGVVDEDLGHAEPVDRLVERRAQRRLVGHVGGEPERLGRAVVQGGERRVDGAPRAGEHGDRRPSRAKRWATEVPIPGPAPMTIAPGMCLRIVSHRAGFGYPASSSPASPAASIRLLGATAR